MMSVFLRILIVLVVSVVPYTINAQVLSVSGVEQLTITGGTMFHAEGLTLTPDMPFTLSGIHLQRTHTVSNNTLNTHVRRVYKFNIPSGSYSGSVKINYADDELNGLNESHLQVNVHNGNTWHNFPSSLNDHIGNSVHSSTFTVSGLHEITLAASYDALPVEWHSFTAVRQGKKVRLHWATDREINTAAYEIQHSTDGVNWFTIGTTPASGNSSTLTQYEFLHQFPSPGLNFYRIRQTDMDGRYSHSEVRSVWLEKAVPGIIVTGNPVINETLLFQLNGNALWIYLTTVDGKILYRGYRQPGLHQISMTGFAKGVYILQCTAGTVKVLLQ